MAIDLKQPRPDQKTMLGLLRKLILVREVEEKIVSVYAEQEMRCPVHLSIGQEATAVGVCDVLSREDMLFSNHRAHAHYIAKGGSLRAFISELYGKVTGCCKGVGGSMHLIDRDAGFIASTPIVGSIVPIAVGAAFANKVKKTDLTTTVFVGDGCVEEGVFYESLNFALLKQLPILFFCENNSYSVYTRLHKRQPERQISDMIEAHGIPVLNIDGNDVLAVRGATKKAYAHIREGKGPFFIEASTYRFREHCGPNFDDQLGYRPEGELDRWQQNCPVKAFSEFLVENEKITHAQIEEIRQTVLAEVEDAFTFAKSSPFPPREQLYQNLYAPTKGVEKSKGGAMSRNISYGSAICEATDFCLGNDPLVFLYGLGVDDPKRIFGTTAGLVEKYGPERVFDCPVAENALTGVGIGAATLGMRPILVHQRLDFALLSLDQIINNAAKWHYMFGGKHFSPITIRMIIGRGWGQGPQHSQSLQALFAHIPGLKVVMPATPHDAKGLLISAVEENGPVIYLEHRWLHGIVGPVPQEAYREPIGKAKVVRSGKDVTIAAISYMVPEAFRAAEALEKAGITAEVLDLRTLRPLDWETLEKSVKKTGRLVVADTGYMTYGVSAEIIAWTSENLFESLKTAPRRIASPDFPVPTTPALSKYFYPRSHDVASVVLSMLKARDSKEGQKLMGDLKAIEESLPADVPDLKFNGPF